jgi:acyl-coenzyme A thioesterase PaaI-like protein
MPALTAINLAEFIPRIFACDRKRALEVVQVHEHGATLRFHASACPSMRHTTLDEPALLQLVDGALLLALVGTFGASARSRACQLGLKLFEPVAPGDLIIEARVTRLEDGLGCGEASIRSADSGATYGMASGTYRIPRTGHAA